MQPKSRPQSFSLAPTASPVPSGEAILVYGMDVPPELHRISSLDSTSRVALRKLLKAGLLDRIEVPIVAFTEKYPNANFFRFLPDQLESFANSFANQIFAQDHRSSSSSHRMGLIKSSSILQGKQPRQIRQIVSISAYDGMEHFLEGRIDRFSIGWDAEKAECSLCKLDYYNGCPHFAGRQYDVGGKLKTAEVIFVNPWGVETSYTPIPAVQGTRLLVPVLSKKRGDMSEVIEGIEAGQSVENVLSVIIESGDVDALAESLQLPRLAEMVLSRLSQSDTKIEELEKRISQLLERMSSYEGVPDVKVSAPALSSITRPSAKYLDTLALAKPEPVSAQFSEGQPPTSPQNPVSAPPKKESIVAQMGRTSMGWLLKTTTGLAKKVEE